MEKVLFYGMTGEKMCFQHVLMNALDMYSNGQIVKIIFEGASVKLIPIFEEEKNQLYGKAKDLGLIAGACVGCAKVMGVYDQIKDAGIIMLDDMYGHAGIKPFLIDGYRIITM